MASKIIQKTIDHINSIHKYQYNFSKTIDKLKTLKSEAVKKNQQEKASYIWCLEQAVSIHSSYLSAFSNLKNNKFYEAWCDLEITEKSLWSIKPPQKYLPSDWNKIWMGGKYDFIELHVSRWQKLYPYKLFFSTEETYKQYCSVCDEEINPRKPCSHEDGEIYNGEMRMRVIRDIKIHALSLVENPARRFSVPFTTDPGTEETIDHYDYTLVKSLSSTLANPFQAWDYEITQIERDYKYFEERGTLEQDNCPCESGKSYKDCCINSTIPTPHYQFTVENLV